MRKDKTGESMGRRKSIKKKLAGYMFLVLIIAFTIPNILSCRMLISNIVNYTGMSVSEVRKNVDTTVVIPLTIVSTIMGILVLLILAAIINKMVVKPLNSAANIVEKIADCNLVNGVDDEYLQKFVGRNDEIGVMARELVTMIWNSNSLILTNNILFKYH